jgi:hypothetical protein
VNQEQVQVTHNPKDDDPLYKKQKQAKTAFGAKKKDEEVKKKHE